MDIYAKIFFLMLFGIINFYLIQRSLKKESVVEFFNVEVVDNKAQWVYNSKLYYAEIKNGKVDYSTKREISL